MLILPVGIRVTPEITQTIIASDDSESLLMIKKKSPALRLTRAKARDIEYASYYFSPALVYYFINNGKSLTVFKMSSGHYLYNDTNTCHC